MQQQFKDSYNQLAGMYGSQFTSQFKDWKAFYNSQYTETYIYDWIPSEVWDLYEDVYKRQARNCIRISFSMQREA